jgi:GlpG protein
MTAAEALRLPLSVDLGGFVALLQRLGVPYRVSEEAGEQVLRVPNEALAEQVRDIYARFPHGDPQFTLAPARPKGVWWRRLRASPATVAVLLATLAVAALTLLGDNIAVVRWLSFQNIHPVGNDLFFFEPLRDSLEAGQWWRLLTPMLLHFGVLHLAMNAMWYWELGERIESRQGGLALLGLTLLFGLISNFAQYWLGGNGLFGGLSGVLYGLLGYCWLFNWLAPHPAFQLPRGVLVMMLVWLLVCMSGVVDLLGFGSIANAAHVGGLVAGCVSGLLGGALVRLRR